MQVMASVALEVVPVQLRDGCNVVIGTSHFIQTVEDIHEIVVSTNANAQFGLAFCEASGPRLIRQSGNNDQLKAESLEMAKAIGAGHSFVLLLRECYPINVLNAIKQCREVCTIHCATANPLEVIVAVTNQGRGIMGVVDGGSPLGVEGEADAKDRRDFLRTIGYKL